MKITRAKPIANIKKLGVYINPNTQKSVSVYTGKFKDKNKLFYNRNGYRIVITQKEFKSWEKG